MEKNLKQQVTNTIKIAFFGPESTGKTTLAKQLAQHFDTVWTPEFARDYLQKKWETKQQVCAPEDLLPIAIGQIQLENEALLKANKYLFCDTNLLVTKVFSEMYYNYCDPILDKAAKKHKYDLFFLTDIDVPWQKDDLRDQPNERAKTFEIFQKALIDNQKPYIILSGTQEQRFQNTLKILSDFDKIKAMGFSSRDFVQIYNHGIAPENIDYQLSVFKKGIAKTILDRPATKEDGILKLSEEEFTVYSHFFETKKTQFKLKKFVPASGAASRMFKFLNEFLNEFNIEEESINAFINRKNANALSVFLLGLDRFPFHEEIQLHLQKKYSNFKSLSKDFRDFYFIKAMMSSKHFDFANKPKGILPFHKYATHIASPIEEHLNESCLYANDGIRANLHFTVSKNHQQSFENIIESIKSKIETLYQNKININFSYQNTATDTIAVDTDNNPFRDENDRLIFRPGGHGALIDNLNTLDADIVFIKNIDNVIQNHIETIALYKKGLAGVLIELQTQIFDFLRLIDTNNFDESDSEKILKFIMEKLNIQITEEYHKYTLENKIEYLKTVLYRPIRVCGMVKNEGEPGGGPFWILDKKGNLSLQIVEASQVDTDNKNQLEILKSATHFNPVDLVCGIKNHKGERFDLTQFIDKNSGFIVEKNKNGKPLKAFELPGLWNGAMAKWTTIFVQVPLITFNPVKTVNDLLKPAHQPQ
jgi:nicotinamide riboside kinase